MRVSNDTTASRGSRRLTLSLVAVAFVALTSGCVKRDIIGAIAHDSYNSYKIQTHSHYFGDYHSYEVWTCHKDGEAFTCAEVDYEGSKAGIKRDESAAPAKEEPVEEAEDEEPVNDEDEAEEAGEEEES